MLLFSRQGKLRLQKWYVAHQDKLKKKITRELITTILARKPKMCSFLEWKDCKIVYKRCVIDFAFMFCIVITFNWFLSRYASLYFCCAVEQNDNELLTLEIIHRYVELLDKYFGSVSYAASIVDSITKPFQNHSRCASSTSSSTSRKLILYSTSCWWAARFRRRRRRTCWKQ